MFITAMGTGCFADISRLPSFKDFPGKRFWISFSNSGHHINAQRFSPQSAKLQCQEDVDLGESVLALTAKYWESMHLLDSFDGCACVTGKLEASYNVEGTCSRYVLHAGESSSRAINY